MQTQPSSPAPRATLPSPSAPAWLDPVGAGVLYALGAFVIWGLSPLYFKAVGDALPPEILAHRVVWSVLLMTLLCWLLRGPQALWRAVAGWRRFRVYLLTTTLITANWLTFIWAIGAEHVVQISLGYYINPLVNVVLGVLFLSERLRTQQRAAVALATVGVAVLVLAHGTLPWISLVLGFSFGFYSLVRKKMQVDPLLGLLVETLLLLPLALAFLFWLAWQGTGQFGQTGWLGDGLLVLSGVITTVPLILFMMAARTLMLSTLGLMQYVAPTLHLVLATLVFGETFTAAHAAAFLCIWTALGLYSHDAVRARRRELAALAPAAE